jgi:putative flippase GtrA
LTGSAALRRRVAQLVRYAATSVVATTASLLTLTALIASAAMRPAPANVVATLVGTVPSFELNRRWVWSVSGRPSLRRQVLPFLGLTFAGLALSTLAVGAAGGLAERADLGHGETALFAAAANLAAFGTVWVIQFVVLDRLLFKPVLATPVDQVPATAQH